MLRIIFYTVIINIVVFGNPAYTTEEINYSNNEIKLAASLLLPNSAEKLPAVVLVHGSGTSDRSNLWTTAYAEMLAEKGLIVLHPDKRGSGKSGGDWKKASLEDLALDAVAAVNYLLTRTEVDTSRICIIGFSQGGDVVPIAATISKEIDLVIDISGSVVSLKEQIIDEVEKEAEREGVDEKGMEKIRKLNELAFGYAYGEVPWDKYISELQIAKSTELGKTKTFGAFLAERDIWVWDWLKLTTKLSPMEYWKKVNTPILFIYGGNDTQLRTKKSIDLIYAELGSLQKNFSILYFNKNGHALFRDDCNDFISKWIKSNGLH